ncbi:hypothetical protein [Streptomyces sp. b94]|uniref:hypothetical protein n=1 Tax=Streptomyces sp. b94 TaxID=1827634 RepID=UPI000BF24774|nr:hypothetical protein [Streptomyces sp. b94]
MRPVSVHPLVRFGAGAFATAGILLAGLAAPASAAESDQLWIAAPHEKNLQAGGAATPVEVGLYHDNDNFTVTDGRLTVDVSGLAGVAEVSWPENCAPSGTSALCSVAEVPVTGGDHTPQVRLEVRAADGAEAGARGRITYAASATGGPDGTLEAPLDSFDTTLTVSSGPDLVLDGLDAIEGATPGTVHTVPLSVTNAGAEPAQGFTLGMMASHGLGYESRYDACTYTRTGDDGYAPMSRAECAFDRVLRPGETFTLPEPLRIAVAEHALRERLDVDVRPGGGATDIDEGNNYRILAVDAVNTADFAVRGSKVSGAAGETVKAALTFRNKGPAWIGNLGSGDAVALVDFTVPEGVTVTRAPAACDPRTLDGGYRPGRTGAPRYVCEMPYWVLEDAVRTFRFDLRVDTVVPDAKGLVALRPVIAGTSFPHDPKPGNDKGWVTVNPTPAA